MLLIPNTGQGSKIWPQFVHSLYLTYSKFIFSFGLSLIILPYLILPQSHQIFIRFILDTKIFNFIAKISFWVYLIHVNILLYFYGSRTYDFYYNYLSVYVLFVSFAVISIIIGTIMVYLV